MATECEDCGEETPKGERRWRCPNCGSLVCGWCRHHVHEFAAARAKSQAAGQGETGG